MKRAPKQSFVVTMARLVLISIVLPGSPAFLTEHSTAQNPNPKPAGTDQDCEKLKGEINNLNEMLVQVNDRISDLERAVSKQDQAIGGINAAQDELEAKSRTLVDALVDITRVPAAVVTGGWWLLADTSDEYDKRIDKVKSDVRNLKSTLENRREQLKNDIENARRTLEAIKDVLADLLKKLGDCGKTTDDATKAFVDCLQKYGAERDLTDPERAHNPKTDHNFVWDNDKKSWIDTKTGECVCPKCPATTPTTVPSPRPSPTSNPTPPPSKNTGNQVGYHVDTKTANGLFVTTFDTPQGKIKVNLTDDVAAGDTISGTVETEPTGKNDAERAQNQAELNGYVIELEGQKTTVGDKKITCNIPTTLGSDGKTIVLVHNGQRIVTSEVPIAITPPPRPTQFTVPTGGQQGRPIEIKGPCRGVFSPQDYVKIGETVLPPVAKSSRKIVVQNTSNTVGPSTIECKENGLIVQCPFRIIGVRVRAAKLNLRSGETTLLTVDLMGFKGIKEDEDASLDLINDSTGVIKMSGGDVQHYKIKASPVQADGTLQVRADGTCSFDRTLTGIRPGGFGVTANVKVSNVCRHPAK